MNLTGRYRYKRTFFGKMKLEVEWEFPDDYIRRLYYRPNQFIKVWTNAAWDDLFTIKVKRHDDVRFRRDIFGNLILQKYKSHTWSPSSYNMPFDEETQYFWVDADWKYVLELERE